jgi:4-amino-4-deoxy-L-arabinose transferase-like glycosyltransferase
MWSTYFFAALATMTKGLVGILLPGAVIFTWLLLFNEWRQLKSAYYFTGISLFLLIVAPWHIAVQLKNPEFFHFYFIEQQFTRYLTNYADRVEPNWFFIPILIFGLYPWVIFLIQAVTVHLPRSWRTRSEQKEPLFLLIWAAVIFIFFSLSQSKLIPYILPTVPPLSLLIGNYLAQSPRAKGFQRGLLFLLPLTILISIAVWIALHFFTASNPSLMKTEMWGMFIISIIGACLAYWIYHWRGTIAACATIAMTNALILLILMAVIPLIDMGSIVPLTNILQPRLKPTDEVVSYHNYYQDMPLYLQRRVTIVDWQNELTFGMEHQDTKQWMIDDATFWQRWQSPQTLYMIATQKIYHLQLLHKNVTMHLLGQTEHDVLLSNH